MNTPAHMALSLAILGRRAGLAEAVAITIGALLPDLLLLIGMGLDMRWVLPAVPVLNSVLLWAALLAIGAWAGLTLLSLLSASALLHIAMDFPLHAADARPHFWPLTDWAFTSPFSFWDTDHHGLLFGTLEGILFVGCLWVILCRWRSLSARIAAAGFAAIYLLTFIHFLGHGVAGQHWAVW